MVALDVWAKSCTAAIGIISCYRATHNMSTRTRISFALALLFAFSGAAAHAQSESDSEHQLKQLTLEQLGNLEVVTRSKAPEQVWKAPAAVFVITQEDIRRAGVTSLPEALRLAPGVEVERISEDKWAIGIRGFSSRLNRSVLVLIDGRSVYTTLIAGTYWEVQDTMLEDVDRIEVIRGPGGTVWGPNAVDGVINIITKNSKETQGTMVSAVSGNLQKGMLSARYGGTASSGLSYRFYGKAFDRGPEYHFDHNNYDHWRSVQSGFRMDWAANQRDSFTVSGDMYAQAAGETVTRTTYTPPFSAIAQGNADLSGANILARWTRVYREGEDLQVQAYFDRTVRHEPNFGDIRNTFDVDFLQRFYLNPKNHLTWGLGARASHGHQPDVVSGLYFDPNIRTDQLYTAFLEDDITLVSNRLTAEIGTKLLHTNYTGFEAEPSGRLLWTRSPTESVWLAATRAVRTPSDGERDFFLSGYLGTAPGGLPYFARFNANRNFQSEILNGYELGYRRLIGPNLYVDVAGFFNQYDDLFSEEVTGAPFVETNPAPTHVLLPAQFRNGLRGSTTGGEIAPEWRPLSFWRLRGSYSFLRMSLRKSPLSADVGSSPFIESQTPQHELRIQSGFDITKWVQLDLDYRYVSALPRYTIPGYSTGDGRVAWNINRKFQLALVGHDLLQPHHIEYPSDPGPDVAIKRSFFFELLWRSKTD
jgi:iron complex outermembrane receptor protein